MSARSKLVLGLVGAAAAGVVIGLLLAPDSGSATRQRIKDTTGDWTSHLGDLFSSAKDEVDNLTKKGSKAASAAARQAADVKESYI
ncbi:MAG TPA: YtxH domain-containing protein [Flavisolibacter sp.]|jgi:gas vesicle protein|nr:YtxH domain-containing protein [Flavisolibacter sp.]